MRADCSRLWLRSVAGVKEGFRQAMAWLHTWAGLVFGWLLFAIFLTGTLSYFKDEITQWTKPELVAADVYEADGAARAQQWLTHNAADSKSWFIRLPSDREPQLTVGWRPANGAFQQQMLDAQTGAPAQVRQTMGGEFFYRFHYQLQMPYPWGRWLASIAAMMMFVALISGIITHKKIFKEFFTFRPRKGQRTWLDGHNAVAVLVLPFHLMITYSSLVIFMTMIMPASILTSYGKDTSAFFSDLFPAFNSAPPAAEKAELAPLGPMVRIAQDTWQGGRARQLTVNNPGSANATVVVGRNNADQIPHSVGAGLVFDGHGGQLVSQMGDIAPALLLASGLYGLHMGHFAGPLVRWLYFLCGIGGTAMIGTGLVIWLSKRQLKHAKLLKPPLELRCVEVLNIASMAGLMLAVAGFFWANRLLPVSFAGRSDGEISAFFWIWGLTVVHAAARVFLRNGRTAWREQLAVAAVLYAGLPVLDMVTAGDLLLASVKQGRMTLIGLDLTALLTGIFLAWGALRFRERASPVGTTKGLAARSVRGAPAPSPEAMVNADAAQEVR